MSKLAIIALGGNALLRSNQSGTISEQEENAFTTMKQLIPFFRKDYNLIFTHGNGPQVGNILLRNEAGYDQYKIPKMPLDICVADSQGSIGLMLEQQLMNVLAEELIERTIVTMLTQVLVDPEDEAFSNPTKPVGRFFIKEEADLLAKTNNWKFKEDARKRGYRRVVPSPAPVDIMNKETIRQRAESGDVVIAVGGGGIPVMRDKKGKFVGSEAVIDKDLASSMLASKINADEFYILTDVPKAYINFGKPDEKPLDVVTVSEMEQYYEEGHFGAGSMGPKIKACINFVKSRGGKAIISETSQLFEKNAGTTIVP